MAKDSKRQLLLQIDSRHGAGELSAGLEHPLLAHFGEALNYGKSTGSWRYLIVNLPGSSSSHVAGTLVRTAAGRTLFFPTYAIFATMDDGTGGLVDHLTLDRSLEDGKRRSHIALQRSQESKGDRGLNHQVGTNGAGLDYWFSILIPLDADHTPLPARMKAHLEVETRGLQNRLEVMVGERIADTKLGLPDSPPDAKTLQLDFWISDKKPDPAPTQAMGFRLSETQPPDTSIQPAGQVEFDFEGESVWFRVMTSLRIDETDQVRLFRSRFDDGFAEMMT